MSRNITIELAVHRLAADGPSWEPLLADLRSLLGGGEAAVPASRPAAGPATELTEEESRALLDEAAPHHGASPEELIAASLAQAVGVWSGVRQAGLEVEVRAPGETVAVGGLAALVPLRAEIEPEPAAALKRIKDELRRAAAGGAGPGSSAPAVVLRWRGRFAAGEPLRPRPVLAAGRTVEAAAAVVDGRLRIDWLPAEGAYRPEALRALTGDAAAALRAWIHHQPATAAGDLVPSDFPAAGLSQEALDDLLAELTTLGEDLG